MDEGVYLVDLIYDTRVLKEPGLDRLLDENTEMVFGPDGSESVSSSVVHCSTLRVDGEETTAHLID